MRNSSIFFLGLTSQVILLSLLLIHASLSKSDQQTILAQKAALVKTLRLTDLCLFTEARYTRHLSQDHPLSLEHFPSGSFTQPNLENKTP